MIIHGHILNGQIVPDGGISLPDGTEVTIFVCNEQALGDLAPKEIMSPEDRNRQSAALVRIDSMSNENPGDSFRGADHDLALCGGQP